MGDPFILPKNRQLLNVNKHTYVIMIGKLKLLNLCHLKDYSISLETILRVKITTMLKIKHTSIGNISLKL